MQSPRVSICLPNLNTRPFLAERFRSILAQEFTEWELLVYDSHSDDGSWEYIQDVARTDSRVTAWQGPREGIYPGWNACLSRARGEFVYIATSDDTMPPNCLAKLVAALDEEPECGLAHCRLRFVDADGNESHDWFTPGSAMATSTPELLNVRHVRLAPLDGLLHLAGASVYFSITQLLIRRAVIQQVGPFENRWGAISDFNWNMRASLTHHTVHVPDTWGGWRVHPKQASAQLDPYGSEYQRYMQAMMTDALDRCAPHLPPPMRAALPGRWQNYHERRNDLRRALERRGSRAGRLAVLVGAALGGSVPARDALKEWLRIGGREPVPLPRVILQWATSVVGHELIRLPPSNGGESQSGRLSESHLDKMAVNFDTTGNP